MLSPGKAPFLSVIILRFTATGITSPTPIKVKFKECNSQYPTGNNSPYLMELYRSIISRRSLSNV